MNCGMTLIDFLEKHNNGLALLAVMFMLCTVAVLIAKYTGKLPIDG